MDSCEKWLLNFLKGQYRLCEHVREEALAAGFSRAELKAARKSLGVKTWHQVDTLDEPRIDNWFWYLQADYDRGILR